MQLSDFQKRPRGPYAFEHWIGHARFPSPVGDFALELQTPVGDLPDDRMLQEAVQLAREFEQHTAAVAERVFEHYQQLQGEADWLRECGVPAGLSLTQLAPYLRERSLVVSRDVRGNAVYYNTGVYVSPMWDIEHGICLKFTGAGIIFE